MLLNYTTLSTWKDKMALFCVHKIYSKVGDWHIDTQGQTERIFNPTCACAQWTLGGLTIPLPTSGWIEERGGY